jgi:hypothetical protein
MKKLLLIILLALGLLIVCCSCGVEPKYPFSDSPYDNVYESTFYSDNASWVITSKTCPIIDGNSIIITNYWWQEYDEEGNEEWIRYENDFYRMVIPLNKASVEIIYMPDKENNAHIVQMWDWDSEQTK